MEEVDLGRKMAPIDEYNSISWEFDHGTPATSQGRTPRRNGLTWSGGIGIHTCENTPDTVVPDLGAEGVRNYIFTRSDPGSYHGLCDSDSRIWIAHPGRWETWQIAARNDYNIGYNWYTAGISMAYRASLWGDNQAYEDRMIDNCGYMVATFMLIYTGGNIQEALKHIRWISPREASDRVPGLFEHGLVQPVDRSDAWAKHPNRDALREKLVVSAKHYLGDSASTAQRKVPTNMFASTHRSNGQGLRVMIWDAKVYYSWQNGSPGNWGTYSPWNACPMFGGKFAGVSPKNDPGAFDNVIVEVNDKDQATIQAFHSFYGPGAAYSCWETTKGGGGQFTDWSRIS